MFRLFYSNNRRDGTTVRNAKSHAPGSKREKYSSYTLKTLGSGDTLGAVKLPEGEDINEWYAANTVDFFNEVRLIWDIVCEVGVGEERVGSGFPPGFEYRWADSRSRQPISCSGLQYVNFAIEWMEGEISNEALFPTSSSTPFPSNFVTQLKVIYTRIFRIFAIIYSHHFSRLESIGAAAHLNTSFKHFLFFAWEYELIKQAELEALHELIEEIKNKYGGYSKRPMAGSGGGGGSSVGSNTDSHNSNNNSSNGERATFVQHHHMRSNSTDSGKTIMSLISGGGKL